MSDDRDFYVGYLPKAPRELGRWLRRRVAAVLALGVALAVVLVASQGAFPVKRFEWQDARTFIGYVQERPVPSLLVRRPGRASGQAAWTRHLLVRFGKAGAAADVAGFDGRAVQIEGNLIYREDQTMIQLAPGGVAPLSEDLRGTGEEGGGEPRRGGPGVLPIEDLGRHTFVGEIVDSKCYLGVMSPGSTKPHRACAARCISGGIPPVLLVRQEDGRATYLLLLAADGSCVNDEVASIIAEPVEITGRVERHADLLVLKADPQTYRRLES